jgi:FtsH-binding integral membrane protein
MNTSVHTTTQRVAVSEEQSFLRHTYFHLLGAVAVFLVLEIFLFQSGIAYAAAPVMASNWLIVIGGFMVLGWLSSYFTRGNATLQAQYLQLGITIALQAVIFIPLLVYAVSLSDPSVLANAVLVSLIIFGTMTAIVGYTGKNFSFLGPFLAIIGIAALLAIVGSVLFSVSLGFYFAIAMVVFAAALILYETSKVVYDFGPGQHVMAATGLFASVALLFYYVLSAFISNE